MKENLFMFLGGLGIFLFGIKLMGDSLKGYAGDDLRDIINKYTRNPFMGVFTGAVSTVVLQSSSGTTALTISLVRAGLMGLKQAIGVIMGANIGTTVTAFLLGLAIKDYSLIIIFFGAIVYMFASKRKHVYIGQIIFGFGALFFGMSLMETPLKLIAEQPWFEQLMLGVGENPILGVLIGTGLTMLVQSSSATIGILQGIYASGAVGFPVALAILLGDNIGTTITSLIASVGGSRDSKRAALSHVIFNIFGTVVFFIIFFGFNLSGVYTNFITHLGLNKPLEIAFTHFFFNISVTFILIWFVKQMESIVKKIIPIGKDEIVMDINEHFLDEQLVNTAPALALQQGRDGLMSLADIVSRQMQELILYVEHYDVTKKDSVLQLEIGINAIDKKLKHFYMELSTQVLTDEDSYNLNSYMYSLNDFERIGDHIELVAISLDRFIEKKELISDVARSEILKMLTVAQSALKNTIELYKTGDLPLVGKVLEKEKHLDNMERKYYKTHLARVKQKECTGNLSIAYVDLLSSIERIGDHCQNIVEYYTNNDQVLTKEEAEFDIAKIIA